MSDKFLYDGFLGIQDFFATSEMVVDSSDAMLNPVRAFLANSQLVADSRDALLDGRRTLICSSGLVVESSDIEIKIYRYPGGSSEVVVISKDAFLTYLGLPESPSGRYEDDRLGSPTSGTYQEGIAAPTGSRRIS